MHTEARQRTHLPCNFSVLFYAGKYFMSFGSIFPVEDIIGVIPPAQVGAVVLGGKGPVTRSVDSASCGTCPTAPPAPGSKLGAALGDIMLSVSVR